MRPRPPRERPTRPDREMSRVSESTIRRLSHYYRVLEEVESEGKRLISSHRLAEREGITSAQVRKDLSVFGSFGRRGLGYNVAHLREQIRTILGMDHRWRVVLVGSGNIGSALLSYRGFEQQGFDLVAAFDRDTTRVGQRFGRLVVRDIADLPAAARAEPFDMGVIATPLAAAQEVADLLVAAGVRGILNFAPRKLRVPDHVALRTVDMAVEFESLSFELSRDRGKRRRSRT
ncbi:MAG: redox-sensing transcriptional repressor Rex [Candidatus Eisenbacteria bacterium]|uniref:Redox-sensing transcriptional repressor Rex n=1 Tax=Eiseniibacteriota bacterium TaxID=2212470 RepID=A0A849SLS9_UNCEI|nr:redox-sensing transcriptional repressor Rex [Candidatus Eisenbacteria bacterium]